MGFKASVKVTAEPRLELEGSGPKARLFPPVSFCMRQMGTGNGVGVISPLGIIQ